MIPEHDPRDRVLPRLARFWADDRGLSVFCALLVVVVFVLPPLVEPGSGRSLAGDLVYGLLLVSGVRALGDGRAATRVLMGVTLVTLAVDLGSWFWPVPEPWVLGTSLTSLLLFLAVVLGRTLRDGPVTVHRLQGGVAAYLLLGVIWANAYALVARLRPGAFTGLAHVDDGSRGLVYFSFVTLTTTGFGDVVPVHPVARSLAMAESVTGTLYLAILIARLVSQAQAHAQAGGRG